MAKKCIERFMKKLFIALILIVLLSQQMIFAQTKIDKSSEDWVKKTLKSMTLREKIGQMIVTGVLGDYKNVNGDKFAEVRKQIVENKVGGFVFYRGDALELAALTNEMQAISKVPLFMAADFERGLPMQIRSGTSLSRTIWESRRRAIRTTLFAKGKLSPKR